MIEIVEYYKCLFYYCFMLAKIMLKLYIVISIMWVYNTTSYNSSCYYTNQKNGIFVLK